VRLVYAAVMAPTADGPVLCVEGRKWRGLACTRLHGPLWRLPQAKDVPEDAILRVLRTEPGRWFTHWPCHRATCDLAECWSLPCRAPELAAFPEKVLRAKLSSMMRRKLVDGCDCGCRGDWHIPALFYAR